MAAIKKQSLFIFLSIIMISCLIAGCNSPIDYPAPDVPDASSPYSWVKERYIAHALGGIDGYSYTNSKEAFLRNYEKGFRVFEVDVIFSSDNELVCLHDWKNSFLSDRLGFSRPDSEDREPMSSKDFLSIKIKGKYTPLSFNELLSMINEHNDTYLILDTKYEEKEEIEEVYRRVYDTAVEISGEDGREDLLKRLIPQLYSEEMYDWVTAIHPFDSMIFTWYRLVEAHEEDGAPFDPEQEMDFAEAKGIRAIVMGKAVFTEDIGRELRKRKLFSYAHTVNKEENASELFHKGVYGIYTDTLPPYAERLVY